jgi:hypothetical protein
VLAGIAYEIRHLGNRLGYYSSFASMPPSLHNASRNGRFIDPAYPSETAGIRKLAVQALARRRQDPWRDPNRSGGATGWSSANNKNIDSRDHWYLSGRFENGSHWPFDNHILNAASDSPSDVGRLESLQESPKERLMVSLFDRIMGIEAATAVGVAMGDITEGMSYEESDAKYGTLCELLPHEYPEKFRKQEFVLLK